MRAQTSPYRGAADGEQEASECSPKKQEHVKILDVRSDNDYSYARINFSQWGDKYFNVRSNSNYLYARRDFPRR